MFEKKKKKKKNKRQKRGLYIMNGKKILFGAAYDGLLLFLMRGAY